jgi:hypothetical protein
MNLQRCLLVARRINTLLIAELGIGIDVQRMAAETLYARDVLLVCDAHPGTELATLAQDYRLAQVEALDQPVRASLFGRLSSGFGASEPAPTATIDPYAVPVRPLRPGWLSPARWLKP